MPKRALVGLAVALLCTSISSRAVAQSDEDRQRARELGQAGLALFDKGDYAGALSKLDEAEAIVKVPTIGLFAARSLDRLDRMVEARARLAQVVAIPLPPNSPEVWQQAKTDAAKELAVLGKETPRVVLDLVGVPAGDESRVLVSVDGRAAPLEESFVRVNPGKREVVVRLGERARSFSIDARRGQSYPMRADLTPPAAPQVERAAGPNVLTVVGGVTLGLGGAGLVVWGATGGAALAKASDYGCDGARCQVEDVGDLDTLCTTSLISFYVGGGLALAGTGLLIAGLVTSDDEPAAAAVLPVVGPGWLGVAGSF